MAEDNSGALVRARELHELIALDAYDTSDASLLRELHELALLIQECVPQPTD